MSEMVMAVFSEFDPDLLIIWAGPELTSFVEDAFGDVNLYFYEGSTGIPGTLPPPYDSTCGYWIDSDPVGFTRVISDLYPDGTGNNVAFDVDTFILKYDIVQVVAGTPVVHLDYTPGREGEWWELFRLDLRIDTPAVDNVADEVLLDVTIALWDGVTGDPALGTAAPTGPEAVRRVRIHAMKVV